jgi:nucleoside-diphosphate-sugar epimerase
VHVSDAADALVAAGTAARLAHDAFNIAGDTAVTRPGLRRLVRRIGSQPARASEPRWLVPRFWIYDIRRARVELGFTPRVPLVDGIREMVTRISRSTAAA